MGLAPAKADFLTRMNITGRVIAAIVGGYVLANLVAILLSYCLPGSQISNVTTGVLASYLVYAAVVIWVFSVKTLRTVAWGLTIPCVVCAAFVFAFIPKGIL